MHPQLRVARMTAVVLAVAAVLIAVGGAQANVTLTPATGLLCTSFTITEGGVVTAVFTVAL